MLFHDYIFYVHHPETVTSKYLDIHPVLTFRQAIRHKINTPALSDICRCRVR